MGEDSAHREGPAEASDTCHSPATPIKGEAPEVVEAGFFDEGWGLESGK